MKNKTIALAIALAAAILHLLPATALVMIAGGGEVTRALGACLLLVAGFGLGYIHGQNNSFKFMDFLNR